METAQLGRKEGKNKQQNHTKPPPKPQTYKHL